MWRNLEKLNEESIITYLKGRLKEERFEHCINVMKMAVKLAEMYQVDIYNAKFAGLLHDCAKNMKNPVLNGIDDINAVINALKKILSDETKYMEMRKAVRKKHTQNHTWAAVCNRMMSIIKK